METPRDSNPRQPRHLPYEINPDADRAVYYENYWKEVALKLVLQHGLSPNQTVLDYGSGRGETLQIFGQAGFQVTGTDVDPECVRLSSRFGPAVVLNPDAPVDQFGSKSFDLVTCFHVLEHVEQPKKVLSDLARIARHHVVLAVPNLRKLNNVWERHFHIENLNEGHLHGWDHIHLRNLAERFCGLELVGWESDATVLSFISNVSNKILGQKMTIWLETGLFRRIFPFHSISIIGLFKVKPEGATAGSAPSRKAL